MHDLEHLIDQIQKKTGFDPVSRHSWFRLYLHFHILESHQLGLRLGKDIKELPSREKKQMEEIDIYISAIEYFKNQYKTKYKKEKKIS